MTIGKYTNNLQACILFDDAMALPPARSLQPFIEKMSSLGMPFEIMQETPDSVFMMGPGELQVMATFRPVPAELAVFAGTVQSAVTSMLTPDVIERVSRHRSHLLVELHHGVLGGVADDPAIREMLSMHGMLPGASLGEFNMRVDVLGEVCRAFVEAKQASLVHWTQSNMLLSPDKFIGMFDSGSPGMLTIHPKIFGGDPWPGYDEHPAGFLTLGATDYIGRDIYVPPVPVPWISVYLAALAFVRVAIMPNGYIIPDGHTFADEDNTVCFEVKHLDGDKCPLDTGRPCYQLTLRYMKEHNFTTPQYETRTRVGSVDEFVEGAPDGEKAREAIAKLREEQSVAEAAGARMEIYRKPEPPEADQPPPAPQAPPSAPAGRFGGISGFVAKRATFGRRH